jgi:hypothetical protein
MRERGNEQGEMDKGGRMKEEGGGMRNEERRMKEEGEGGRRTGEEVAAVGC